MHLEGKSKRKNALVLLCNPCVNGQRETKRSVELFYSPVLEIHFAFARLVQQTHQEIQQTLCGHDVWPFYNGGFVIYD